MIYICIDHATVYCHSRYSMHRKYEYATDKICNLIGNEGNKYRAHFYRKRKKVDITNWCKYSILNPYAILKAGNQSSL